jgi:gamma-glutamylcyclotransferase (GGCT)/AIG2-like uncharacterized protein YtfP
MIAPVTAHLLFVYGTLRRGGSRSLAAGFPSALFVSDATLRGRLYDLGAYPGVVVDAAAGAVLGELYEVSTGVLDALDDYEGCDDGFYARMRAEVDAGGDRIACWVYALNPERYRLDAPIDSGDWIAHANARRARSREAPRPSCEESGSLD